MVSATTLTGPNDAMERPLLVKPEGVQVVESKAVVLELTDGSESQELKDAITLELPAHVEGSARATLAIVGDIMGPSLAGLGRLLRIPTGCGEQNMITLAPNVYVAKYLKVVDRLSPDLEEKIVRNLIVGYGRELTYQHDDGSFS